MKVVVIGGGPAGMIAGIAAAKSKNEVILLEKNEKLGKKLFITGKGRCNVTNNCDKETFFKNIVRNPKFMFSPFSQFSNADFMNLLEEYGCKLKVERGNRVFPISDKSYDVTDALKKALNHYKVDVRLDTEVINITQNADKRFELKCRLVNDKKNENLIADRVIVATGGLSYASTGSTGDGYKFAKAFGISVKKQTPSLVPLNVKELDDCIAMQGLSLKNISIRVYTKGESGKIEKIYSDFGEMLFTHFGLSGPVVLSASCFLDIPYDKDCRDSDIDKIGETIFSIDLKPALSEEQLDNRLLREIDENKNKKLKSIIETLLPSSMVDVFIKRLSSVSGKDTNEVNDIKACEISKSIRKNIINLLKAFDFTITSKRGFDEAIITNGGIDIKEINPKTMESTKVKGLYFVGEVLDIDCMTGGFNITIAASTAYSAGININGI